MKQRSRAMELTVAAVGLDPGDRWSHWCALDGRSEVAARGRVATTAKARAEQAGVWAGVRVRSRTGRTRVG